MNENPDLNNNNNINFQDNNNNLANKNTQERNTNTGNMYSYREDSINEPPKESSAIRRSLGGGFNPIMNPPRSQDVSRKRHKNYKFEKISDESGNKNLFIQTSEQRIHAPKEPLFKKPEINKDNHTGRNNNRINQEKNYFFLFTFVPIALAHVILIVLIALLFKLDIEKDAVMKYNHIYIFFKDIHCFIFIGFGFLYSALRDHQWSSIFLVLFVGVMAIEFSFIFYYIWANTFYTEDDDNWGRMKIDFSILSSVEFNAASCLITLGALLGKISLIQNFIIILFETFFSSLNYFLIHDKLKVIDNGGSLTIHLFGALFGLGASCVLFCNEEDFIKINNNRHITSNYYSNMFSFIGSIFLWLFFPSFNVANVHFRYFSNLYQTDGLGYLSENLRYRGIINTYLSLMGSVLSAFLISPLFHNGKMKIDHILHASYVGGIVIGGCCTICSSPWAAILIGFIGGTVSLLFLWRIKNLLHTIRFEDTIGVLQLFAIPGLLGGIASSIFLANFSNKSSWGSGAMSAIYGNGRNKSAAQAGLEVAAIFITLGIAILSGLIAGLFAKLMMCNKIENYFVDSEFFIEEDDGVVFPELEFQETENNFEQNEKNLDLGGKDVSININNNINNNNDNNIINNNKNNNIINNNDNNIMNNKNQKNLDNNNISENIDDDED